MISSQINSENKYEMGLNVNTMQEQQRLLTYKSSRRYWWREIPAVIATIRTGRPDMEIK